MTRVILDRDGFIAHVQLNRPDKHNGIDIGLVEGLIDAGRSLMDDGSLRAVVLSGRGPSFCAGLDVQAFMAAPESARQFLVRGDESPANAAQRVAWIWRELPIPVIGALHGAVYGGGLQIALGADLRLVHPEARLSIMEIKWGLIPDMGLTRTARGLVRTDVLRELTWTGRIVSGQEAVSLGLATQVSEQPLVDAMSLARDIANRNPHAIRAAKQLFEQTPDSTREAFELETRLQERLLGSPNQLEAAMAQLQKRTPDFIDPD